MQLVDRFTFRNLSRSMAIGLCLIVVVVLATRSDLKAQGPNNAAQTPATAVEQKVDIKKKPYLLTSRVHLQKNSTQGYLILRVELPKGSHIYSMTQKGDLRPSKLTVANSKQFRLTGKFAPDRPPEITKYDPLFKQQVEKHKGVVQFFAPIEVAGGLTLEKLAPEIIFDGQVCTEANFCMPILGKKVKGKFAGYFERTARKITTDDGPSKPGPAARNPAKNPTYR